MFSQENDYLPNTPKTAAFSTNFQKMWKDTAVFAGFQRICHPAPRIFPRKRIVCGKSGAIPLPRESFIHPALHHRQLVAAVSSPQSPLGSVSACGKNAARSLGSPLPTPPVSLGRRGDPIFYLYFRLSITASSSQRLLYSFSAWISHPASRMGALFHFTRCGRSESARRQGPAPPDA